MSAMSTTYNGFPVLIHTDTALSQLNLPTSRVSFNTGNDFSTIGKDWQKRDNVKRKYYNRQVQQTYIISSAADIADFTDFFTGRQGRYLPFFAPTFIFNYTSCETVASSATLKVNQAGRDDFYSTYNVMRKDIIIFRDSLADAGQYRKISSVAFGLDSDVSYDTLTLDSAVGANTKSLITDLIWCHFGSDELKVSSIGGGRYKVSFTLIEDQGDLAL